MENMEKRSLTLFLPQNKENCFIELEHSKHQEKPSSYRNFWPFIDVEKRELLTLEDILESESKFVSSRHVNWTDYHLYNVINSKQMLDIVRFSFTHEIRPSNKNKPKIGSKYDQKNEQRSDMDVRFVVLDWNDKNNEVDKHVTTAESISMRQLNLLSDSMLVKFKNFKRFISIIE